MQYHVHRFFKGPYDYQPILSRIEDFKPCRYLTTFWVSIRHVQEFSHELGSDLYLVERDKWVTCYNELVGVVENLRFYIFILQLVPWSPSYFYLQVISVSNNQANLFSANVQSPFSRLHNHFLEVILDPILLLTHLIYFLIFYQSENQFLTHNLPILSKNK